MGLDSTDDPLPRIHGGDITRWRRSLTVDHELPAGGAGPDVPFGRVLGHRHTVREVRPASIDRVATLLWHAGRTRAASGGWQHRAAPSAGGLHPIDMIFVGLTPNPALYDPMRHVLSELEVLDAEAAAAAVRAASEVVPTAQGTLVFLVGDTARVLAAYENPTSLIWRDAGCLIATVQITAAWLGLASVPLGILGGAFLKALGLPQNLVGAGAFVLGEEVLQK